MAKLATARDYESRDWGFESLQGCFYLNLNLNLNININLNLNINININLNLNLNLNLKPLKSATSWDRTRDLQIFSLTLSQLS